MVFGSFRGEGERRQVLDVVAGVVFRKNTSEHDIGFGAKGLLLGSASETGGLPAVRVGGKMQSERLDRSEVYRIVRV
jgi:hypothetical protein